MKYTAILLALFSLGGCASTNPNRDGFRGSISYNQLSSIQVHNSDCPRIDEIIAYVEQQQRLRGTFGKSPEDLNEADRKYNEKARIIVWSLRIGCNNPRRYAQ